MTKPTISDVCLVTDDLEDAKQFYLEKLDFQPRRVAPGFIDFLGPGIILALWDADTIRADTGVPAQPIKPGGVGVMIAVEVESPAEVDAVYKRLSERGIEFYGPPDDYPWHARCVYFAGRCGEFWEFFAWYEAGRLA